MSASHKYKRTDLIDDDRESRLISTMIKIALEDNCEGWKVDKNNPSVQIKKHPLTKRCIYRVIATNESTLTIQDRHNYWQCGYNHQANYNGFQITNHIDNDHDVWYAKADAYGVVSARDEQLMLTRFKCDNYNTLTIDTYHIIGIITYEIPTNHTLYKLPTKDCIRIKQECSAEICYKKSNTNNNQFTYVRIEHTSHTGGWMPNWTEDMFSIKDARKYVNQFHDLNDKIFDVLKKRKLNEIKQMKSLLHMSEQKENMVKPKTETKKDWINIYEQLLQMDFDDASAMEAAQLFPNDLNKAIQMIIVNEKSNIETEKEEIILEDHDEEEKHVFENENENIDNSGNPNIMDTNKGNIEENVFLNDENPDFTNNPNIMDTNYGDIEMSTDSKIYKQLIGMGFNHGQSIKAAELAPDNINDAINIAFGETEIKQDDNNDNIDVISSDVIKNENKQEISAEESIKNQFINFLKRANMERYLIKFEENECADLESIQYIDDDVLKDDLGIKNTILRKRFLAQCRKFDDDMRIFKNEYGISDLLYHRLSKYGIVTVNILCDEIKNKNDLQYKYKIINNSQRQFLWSLIQRSENDTGLQTEGLNV
eukprot:545634_1